MMIQFDHINLRFKEKQIFKDVSVTLPNCGLVLLFGKTGSGKTTFLDLIAGKKLSYQGTITKNEKIEKEIFYGFYQDNLFPYLTVYQNLNMFLTKREMKEAEFYFNKFELMYLLHRKAALLSGGELQKINLIIALIIKADITLLDEALCNIDKDSKPLFLEEIRRLSQDVLVVLTSHDQADRMNASLVLEIVDHQIKTVFQNKPPLVQNEKKKERKKRHFRLGNAWNLFVHKSKKVSIFSHLFLYLLLLTTCVCSLIYRTDYLTLAKRAIDYQNIPVYTGTASYSFPEAISIEKEFWLFRETEQYVICDQLIVTPVLYRNGTKETLKDHTLYISDYLYDLSFQNTDLSQMKNEDYVPKQNESQNPLTVRTFNSTPLSIEIYETDYKRYLPNEEEPYYQSKLDDFIHRAETYYCFVFSNEQTATDLFFLYDRNDGKVGVVGLNNFLLLWKIPPIIDDGLNSDEFCTSKEYLSVLTGIPITDLDLNDYFGKKFTITFEKQNGKKIQKELTFVQSPLYGTYPPLVALRVSQPVFEEIISTLECDKLESLYGGPTKTITFIDCNQKEFSAFLNDTLANDDMDYANEQLVIQTFRHKENYDRIAPILILIFIFAILGGFTLYWLFYLKPDYHQTISKLKSKGYTLRESFLVSYLIPIWMHLFWIGLIVLTSIYLYLPFSKLIGLAF